YHATGGPLTVMKPRYTAEVKGPLEEAAEELGYEIVDSNGAYQTGFDEFQATMRDSQRCSTAKAYLVPAENRTNLDIIGDAHVRRRTISMQDGDKTSNSTPSRGSKRVLEIKGSRSNPQTTDFIK
ncbi:hypothetical protein AVEN_131656-1, partial [Araneus ventricosus]